MAKLIISYPSWWVLYSKWVCFVLPCSLRIFVLLLNNTIQWMAFVNYSINIVKILSLTLFVYCFKSFSYDTIHLHNRISITYSNCCRIQLIVYIVSVYMPACQQPFWIAFLHWQGNNFNCYRCRHYWNSFLSIVLFRKPFNLLSNKLLTLFV